jgi:hypothetical protein
MSSRIPLTSASFVVGFVKPADHFWIKVLQVYVLSLMDNLVPRSVSIISFNILENGMILYLKAAEDGISAGNCPFAHIVCWWHRTFVHLCLTLGGSSLQNWTFLDCYGLVMKSLRNKFCRNSVQLEDGDKVVFFASSGSLLSGGACCKPLTLWDGSVDEVSHPSFSEGIQ